MNRGEWVVIAMVIVLIILVAAVASYYIGESIRGSIRYWR